MINRIKAFFKRNKKVVETDIPTDLPIVNLAAALDHLHFIGTHPENAYEKVNDKGRIRCTGCGFTTDNDEDVPPGERVAKHILFFNASYKEMTAEEWANGFADAIEEDYDGILGPV
jgi:hypothetical protein